MPEKALKKLNSYILPEWKVCFFTALFIGLFAHFYKITNWLPNWDSLVFRYDEQNMVSMGRWLLPVVCSFSSFYNLPFLNGVIAIIFHALGGVCICKMLNVKSKIAAGLIGAVIVSFPTVTSVMMYAYVADGYAIAFFLSTLAAVYMTKEKPKFVIPAILIALSAGIYQAYITVTITLVLLHLVDELVFRKASFGTVLKKASKMLLVGLCGVILYAFILKVILRIFSVELLDYQGANQTASLSNIDILASLYVVKETFRKSFFDLSVGVNLYVVMNVIILFFTLVFYLKGIVTNKIYKKPASLIMTILLGIMLVLGAGALAFVNPSVDYHNLMLMGYLVFYLLFIIIYERKAEKNENHTAVKRWIILLTTALIIANQVVIANISYHKAQMAYEKSYGVLVRIADRIEQTEGTESCDKILVIGALSDSEAYSVNLTPDITGITDGYIIRKDDEVVGQSVLTSALNDYCGKNFAFISGDQKTEMLKKEEIKSMEKWPAKNCVTIVDDIVVIKLGTEGEN